MNEIPTLHNHVTSHQLEAFHNNLQSEDEFTTLLSHASNCDYCAAALGDSFQHLQMLTAPKDLKTSILEKSKRIDARMMVAAKTASKQIQLFIYTLKVGTAVLGALYLLFLGIPSMRTSTIAKDMHNSNHSMTNDIHMNSQKITTSIFEFSNQLFQTEANQYD